MNLPMKTIKNYNHFNKTELQTDTSVCNCILGNSISATFTTMLIMAGLFRGMSNKKNSKDFRQDLLRLPPKFTYNPGLEEMLGEIQTRLDKSLQRWGNNDDQPDDYSKSNTSMRP